MILDTCALLFLPSGDPRLTPPTRERLASAASVFYCAISAFEIALKVRDKKLDLPLPPARWVRAVADRYGLVEVPLDTTLCVAATTLPLIHRDPCDRFIIAAAKNLRVPVVTIDPRFQEYGVEVIT
jgi:PIN domain nuclease of toxin-antitoxin system